MKHLFIAGCGRSGTTAIAKLIGSHQKIVMGLERFGHLVAKDSFSLTKEHFYPKRFVDVQPGDTFYDSFPEFYKWDENIYNKLNDNNLAYIGDKRPDLYLVYDELFKNFPNSKLIFVYRNIFDVAASWNKRVKGGVNWPATHDAKMSVHVWSYSLQHTIEAMEKYPDRIACVRYEDIFVNGHDISPLYSWLNLKVDAPTKKNLAISRHLSKQLAKERGENPLSDEEWEYCQHHAPFRYENAIDKVNILNPKQ